LSKIRITKAKVTKEKKISMEFQKLTKNLGWDEYSFTCSEDARPEFHAAMNSLAIHVIEMCELPDEYLNRINVRGVSFSYGGDKEVMGATITAQMKLENSNSDLNLNTPHKASDSYSDGPADEKQLLSDDCIRYLLKLQKECELYIDGERAQVSIFKNHERKEDVTTQQPHLN